MGGKRAKFTTILKLPLSFINTTKSFTYSKAHGHETSSALSNPHGSAFHGEADIAAMADDIE